MSFNFAAAQRANNVIASEVGGSGKRGPISFHVRNYSRMTVIRGIIALPYSAKFSRRYIFTVFEFRLPISKILRAIIFG